jgi:hypothetical protein
MERQAYDTAMFITFVEKVLIVMKLAIGDHSILNF